MDCNNFLHISLRLVVSFSYLCCTNHKKLAMKTITIGGHEVKMYDDIEDLPLLNFQKFNKYALIDAGVGSDLSDVNEHLVKAAKLIPVDPDKAARELQNLQNNINMILTETSPKMLSFAALVYSVDGELNDDLTDEGLKRFSAKLELAAIREVNDALDDSKKKLEEELRAYFPKYFNDIDEKKAHDWQRKKLLIMLEGIIDDNLDGSEKQLKKHEAELLSRYKPKDFVTKDSVAIACDKNFEQTCLVIAQKSGLDPKQMTVQQYYSALENIERQTKAEMKAYKKH